MKRYKKIVAILLSLALIFSTFGIFEVSAATTETRYSKKYLQNGSFEENASSYTWSSKYTQPQTVVVPYWDTTAYNTTGANGKLEFFQDGCAHFNQSSTNKVVADGTVAAELNADEVSTIYQRIETVSGSTYTWGLDHRGRDTTDTMVLFIGPEQYKTVDGVKTAIDPSKPSKTGQDQFVKMTEWLKTQYGVTYPATGCSQKYTIYSKPFAAKGAFQNESSNADENFSMTQTDECTEEWNLWVISSVNNNTSTVESEAIKGWSKYGTNCYNENEDSYNDVINGVNSKLGYDCTYTVPKGQTKTLFAFCSFTVNPNRKTSSGYTFDATYGNLLDDINFKLYQPISSSITEGGNGGVHTGNATITSDIKNGDLFFSTVSDGELCTIRTMRQDDSDTYEFQGAYVTVFEDDGTPVTKFIPIYDGDIYGLTKEEKLELSKKYFLPDGTTTEENGVTKTWDFYFNVSVESPVHIHMMYTKAPYVLYDSNGGEPYRWVLGNFAGGNLIGFRDGFQIVEGEDGTESYYQNCIVNENTTTGELEVEQIGFYKSHDAVPNEKWNENDFGVSSKFLGWAITNSRNEQVILNGNHQVTYDPSLGTGNVKFNNLDENGNIIEDGAVDGLLLDATHGVTLTAQWQFGYTAQAQTLIGHALETQTWENSDVGGWVEETFINDRSNVTDYKDAYTPDRTERTDAYGAVGEKIIFRATPDAANNYVFEGWYTKEADGTYKLVTTAPNLAITVEEGKSEAYYARFKTKTVPVIFHYSASGASDGYDYYLKNTDNKYGKYFQDVVYNETAKQPPTSETPKVTMWFTSPTARDQEHMFDFSTSITKETHLYASPAFNFNYFNHLTIKGEGDPINPSAFSMITFATLKIGNDYIDLKNDSNVSDYNIYLLGGELGDSKPLPSNVKKTQTKYKKGSDSIVFNMTTTTGKSFNRAGVKYDYLVQTAGNPLWVVFDFTYKGITYTTPVINRSMYNQINNYHLERKTKYYTTYPEETADGIAKAHFDLLKSIQDLIEPQASASAVATPTVYADFAEVDGLTVDEASTSNDYTFDSTTAVRNIEPWGFKYTFSINEKDILDFDDYGAVVLTDSKSKYTNSITVNELINDSDSVMFSLSKDNVYLSDDEKSIEVYYVNNIGLDDFDKNTYVVFFVKDDTGYRYSNIISNTYNDVLESDVDNELAPLLQNYYQAFGNYTTAINDAEIKYGKI